MSGPGLCLQANQSSPVQGARRTCFEGTEHWFRLAHRGHNSVYVVRSNVKCQERVLAMVTHRSRRLLRDFALSSAQDERMLRLVSSMRRAPSQIRTLTRGTPGTKFGRGCKAIPSAKTILLTTSTRRRRPRENETVADRPTAQRGVGNLVRQLSLHRPPDSREISGAMCCAVLEPGKRVLPCNGNFTSPGEWGFVSEPSSSTFSTTRTSAAQPTP